MQPAGWYPDPSGRPQTFRFWDGTQWTTATTRDPRTPFPRTTVPAATPGQRSRTPVVVVAVVAVLTLLGTVVFWSTRAGGTPDPPDLPTPGVPVPSTPAPTGIAPTGAGAALNCSGGNGPLTRRTQPTYSAAGVSYDAVPGWSFSFDPSYWTWLDDHSSLGAIRLDDADNEAGITLGSLRHDLGFADPATAGERTAACLEGTLSVESRATAGPTRTEETTLGGMRAWRTTLNYDDSQPEPLLVTILVLDSGQPGRWAQIITFHRPDSSAETRIETALASVRRN